MRFTLTLLALSIYQSKLYNIVQVPDRLKTPIFNVVDFKLNAIKSFMITTFILFLQFDAFGSLIASFLNQLYVSTQQSQPII